VESGDEMDHVLGPMIAFAVVMFVTLLVFLVCREIVCWYWKINEAVGLLQEILFELKKSNQKSL